MNEYETLVNDCAIQGQNLAAPVSAEAIRAEALADPDMKDAIIAGNEVLLNEQAWLLRECRGALDSLIKQRPNMAGLLCGSTTLGNLRAELGAYRPSGVMNGTNNKPVKHGPVAKERILELAKQERVLIPGLIGFQDSLVEFAMAVIKVYQGKIK